MDRVAFTLFGIDIMWYGIMVTSAIIFAFVLYLFIAKRAGIDEDFSLEMFIWVVIFAVIGCRLGYVMFDPAYYPLDSLDAIIDYINIRDGGMTIIGGLFGGALGLYLCCIKNKKYTFAKVCDCIVVALLLGQIIGRWGNFFNQELFGKEITNPAFQMFPFGVYIDNVYGVKEGWYIASFFYEGVLNFVGLIIGLVATFKFKDKLKPFTISLGYFIWYGIVRGSLEFLKHSKAEFGNTNIGIIQTICYTGAIVGMILIVLNQMGYIKFESQKFKEICNINVAKMQEEIRLRNRTSYPNGVIESHEAELELKKNDNIVNKNNIEESKDK